MSSQNKTRFLFYVLLTFLLVAVGCGYLTAQEDREINPVSTALIAEQEPEQVLEMSPLSEICTDIFSGDFESAKTALHDQNDANDAAYDELLEIIQSYEKIEKRREEQRVEAYEKYVGRLEKLKKGEPIEDVNDFDPNAIAASLSDPNDVNDLDKLALLNRTLSTIASCVDNAAPEQKKKLFKDAFVRETFSQAIAESIKLEKKGQWIDAYVVFYSWLTHIDEDNQAWEKYSESLLERAAIASSLEDNLCESSDDRFYKVKKRMFINAVRLLNATYVSILDLDYAQMAQKGVDRVRHLAEVMVIKHDEIRDSSVLVNRGFELPESQAIVAWSAALNALLMETKNKMTGVNVDEFVDLFEKVIVLNKTTVKIPEAILISHFAEAALGAVDPHTVMIWPQNIEEFEKELTKEFIGIGIHIGKRKGMLTALSLLPDTPAYNSGLDAGDIIEKIDGLDAREMSLPCAVEHITGRANTQVTLTVRSPNQTKSREITITRARIIVPTISGWLREEDGDWKYMLDDEEKIAYVKISDFAEKTVNDFESVLKRLERKGMQALVLDLRGNLGGLLESAIAISDMFIDEGMIVYTKPRYAVRAKYATATKRKTHPDYPIVILINNYSASASEIVAGCLADPAHERAILVGDQSHGKGSVQVISDHPGGGAKLKYTMAYYHLPSGQRVESRDSAEKHGRKNWGITPDIRMELRPEEKIKRIDTHWSNSVLAKPGHNNEKEPIKRYSLKETLEADPQLELALLIARTKLIEPCKNTMIESQN